ncbi:methyl-accepting chemotaxis protein [Herbaspirillum sp. RTI4]|uniref:methyl-accepting chemotaxis protein n=1 Tax=Herbaspirillum sp. RTI4 TaxID=3048640 RepID=UPI002AB45758|nr:methyl-accepting chemotaxis protein [Herbaspirillum sp. RTI4]MDY7579877.1 methyl-accepting chemotaxis protein [Herbaspirillum sp. RTI4]MEA9981964.1 methyl-accepting chemotaxis protein [Herbaspirillum sp. RTI4]
MSNMKPGVRLGLGFGIMVVLMLIIAFVSLNRLGQLNSSEVEITSAIYPKAQAAEEVSYLIMDKARIIRNLVLLTDPKALASNKAQEEADTEAVSVKLAMMTKLVRNDVEKQLTTDVENARIPFINYSREVIRLAMEGKKPEAAAALYGDGYKTQGVLLAALKKLVIYQEEQMKLAGEEAHSLYKDAVIITIAIAILACLIAFVLAYFITTSVTKPMAHAVLIAQTITDGNLSSRIDTSNGDGAGELLTVLKKMNDNLQRIVSRVRIGTDMIATASGQIAAGNLDLSSRTEQQASSLEQTVSAIEELTATVKQNADNAKLANQRAISASTLASQGGSLVGQVIDTMSSIDASSKKIVDIISVIDGIAFQTNILALNAAVEAARAGEQGRGFAVVASEVRSLAARSAAAAKEIKVLINDSVEKVVTGSELVSQAGTMMREIVDSVKHVTDIVGEISTASNEQSEGFGQVNIAIAQMDATMQQNAGLVEEAAAAAQSLQEQAGKLAETVSVFKLDDALLQPPAAPKKAMPATAVMPKKPARPATAPQASKKPMAVAHTVKHDGEGNWEQF